MIGSLRTHVLPVLSPPRVAFTGQPNTTPPPNQLLATFFDGLASHHHNPTPQQLTWTSGDPPQAVLTPYPLSPLEADVRQRQAKVYAQQAKALRQQGE
jgi:hypothetical protein